MRKGFTLVELLGVIVILGVIGAIVIPVVQNNLKESAVNACEAQVKSFEKAARNYVNQNPFNKKTSVTLKELQDAGFLKDGTLKNPMGGNFDLDTIVEINNSYSYPYSCRTGNYVSIRCNEVVYEEGTTCSKKCGGGTYNRLAYDKNDGSRCSSKDQTSGGSACNEQECCSNVTYKDGTTCTKACGGGTYNRLAYSTYDNSRCSGSDQSSGGSACNEQECCSNVTYKDGTTCSKTCGGGTYNRLAYSTYDNSRCSGSDQTSGGSACNEQACCNPKLASNDCKYVGKLNNFGSDCPDKIGCYCINSGGITNSCTYRNTYCKNQCGTGYVLDGGFMSGGLCGCESTEGYTIIND